MKTAISSPAIRVRVEAMTHRRMGSNGMRGGPLGYRFFNE